MLIFDRESAHYTLHLLQISSKAQAIRWYIFFLFEIFGLQNYDRYIQFIVVLIGFYHLL